jgi:hypothetical protein
MCDGIEPYAGALAHLEAARFASLGRCGQVVYTTMEDELFALPPSGARSLVKGVSGQLRSTRGTHVAYVKRSNTAAEVGLASVDVPGNVSGSFEKYESFGVVQGTKNTSQAFAFVCANSFVTSIGPAGVSPIGATSSCATVVAAAEGPVLAFHGPDNTVRLAHLDTGAVVSASGVEYRLDGIRRDTLSLSPDGEFAMFRVGNVGPPCGHSECVVYDPTTSLIAASTGAKVADAAGGLRGVVWALHHGHVGLLGAENGSLFVAEDLSTKLIPDLTPRYISPDGKAGVMFKNAGMTTHLLDTGSGVVTPSEMTFFAASRDGSHAAYLNKARELILRTSAGTTRQVGVGLNVLEVGAVGSDGSVVVWASDVPEPSQVPSTRRTYLVATDGTVHKLWDDGGIPKAEEADGRWITNGPGSAPATGRLLVVNPTTGTKQTLADGEYRGLAFGPIAHKLTLSALTN